MKTNASFEGNEEVLIRANNVSDAGDGKIAKFFAVYEGPYTMKNKVGANTFLLIDPTSMKERGKFHASKLKRYRRALSEARPSVREQ